MTQPQTSTEPQNFGELVGENVRLRGELEIAAEKADMAARTIAELKKKASALKKTLRKCQAQLANVTNQRNELRDKMFDQTLAEVNANRELKAANMSRSAR
ncbi:hypothetical protein [Nocardia tengchongensis]|uniref:hypothetical protein n=1 Tax=Nocardia tengchongensis TaxID=2055889 RepID=UPI0036143A20